MRRFRIIEQLQEQFSSQINARSMGKVVQVLFEGLSRNRWRGRTPTNKLVFVESEKDLAGKLENVRITWTGPWSMIGTLVGGVLCGFGRDKELRRAGADEILNSTAELHNLFKRS